MPSVIGDLVVPSREPHLDIPRRILLIDGETADRQLYGQRLRGQGFSVRFCSSHEEGVELLKREKFDFVIVDQGTPSFEGKLVLKHSIAQDRNVPVLVITRFHDMACYMEAMQLGAVDYLEKPVPLADLLWAIETHLPATGALAYHQAS